MDVQDLQDNNRLFMELTCAVIGRAFEVINELGSGFLESVYEKAMLQTLIDAGISAETQKPVKVQFRGWNSNALPAKKP